MSPARSRELLVRGTASCRRGDDDDDYYYYYYYYYDDEDKQVASREDLWGVTGKARPLFVGRCEVRRRPGLSSRPAAGSLVSSRAC